jgi:hypothetical protein
VCKKPRTIDGKKKDDDKKKVTKRKIIDFPALVIGRPALYSVFF